MHSFYILIYKNLAVKGGGVSWPLTLLDPPCTTTTTNSVVVVVVDLYVTHLLDVYIIPRSLKRLPSGIVSQANINHNIQLPYNYNEQFTHRQYDWWKAITYRAYTSIFGRKTSLFPTVFCLVPSKHIKKELCLRPRNSAHVYRAPHCVCIHIWSIVHTSGVATMFMGAGEGGWRRGTQLK